MSGTLYKLDASNGKEIKRVKIGSHPIYSDILYYDKKIYLSSSDLYLWCLDMNCNILWKHSLIDSFEKNGKRIFTDQIAGGTYFQSKPTAANNMVFIGTPSRFIFAFDHKSGKEKWKFEVGGAISAAPAYDKGNIYFGQMGGEDDFYCVDTKTGLPIWKQSLGWTWGSANISNDLIFVPTIEGFAYCLDSKTGNVVWRYRAGKAVCTEPVNYKGMVIFGSWDSYLYAFDEKTGDFIWQYYLSDSLSDSGVQLANEEKLYFPMFLWGEGSKYRCLDIKTGNLLWDTRDITEKNVWYNASSAYYKGHLYISASYGQGLGGIPVKNKIHCIDAESGKKIWVFDDGGGLTPPVVANGKVYFGSTASPYLYCVDAEGNNDGTTNCYFRIMLEKNFEETALAIYKERVYALNAGGWFYAIK